MPTYAIRFINPPKPPCALPELTATGIGAGGGGGGGTGTGTGTGSAFFAKNGWAFKKKECPSMTQSDRTVNTTKNFIFKNDCNSKKKC